MLHPNPTNTVGLGFFYTGSGGAGDTFRTYALDKTGNWDSLLTIQNTIDGSFQDGANWQTFSANANGHTSPVVPMDFSEHFHQNSKLKFELTADANDEDIGYWFDEFVLIYDQVARETEYAFESRGIQTTGSLPDDWGKVSIEVSNTGNISDRLLPILNGIDEDWQYYFAHSTGATIPQNAGFTIMPGESRQIDLFLRPDVNETIGFKQMDLVFQSARTLQLTQLCQFHIKFNLIGYLVLLFRVRDHLVRLGRLVISKLTLRTLDRQLMFSNYLWTQLPYQPVGLSSYLGINPLRFWLAQICQ